MERLYYQILCEIRWIECPAVFFPASEFFVYHQSSSTPNWRDDHEEVANVAIEVRSVLLVIRTVKNHTLCAHQHHSIQQYLFINRDNIKCKEKTNNIKYQFSIEAKRWSVKNKCNIECDQNVGYTRDLEMAIAESYNALRRNGTWIEAWIQSSSSAQCLRHCAASSLYSVDCSTVFIQWFTILPEWQRNKKVNGVGINNGLYLKYRSYNS